MGKYIWYMVGTGTKFDGIWAENGAVDGDVAAGGRMSGLDGPDVRALDPGTNRMNTAWRG